MTPIVEPKKIEEINSKSLTFDPKNPRFYRLAESIADADVIEEMLEDEGVQSLMSSIGHQGFFPGEPVLVVKGARGKFTVVEGNRRLAAVKLLNGELQPPPRKTRSVGIIRSEAIHHPTKLPCIVYNDRAEVLRYLGYRHITGIKEWDSLSKAKYLLELRDTFYSDLPPEKQLKTLAKEIGSRSDIVGQLLTSLALYDKAQKDKFFKKNNLNEESIDFSYITTALSYTSITDWLGLENRTDTDAKNLDEENLDLLLHWMFVVQPNGKTVLRETRRLKDLAAVVASPDSLRVLLKTGDLDDAYLYTDGPTLALSNALSTADAKLRVVWDMLLGSTINDEHKISALEIRTRAQKIYDYIASTQESKIKESPVNAEPKSITRAKKSTK